MDRASAVEQLLGRFAYGHLPEILQAVSRPCSELGAQMADALPDGPELTTGLRKLLEAKGCFVRAALEARESAGEPDGIVIRRCDCGATTWYPADVSAPVVVCGGCGSRVMLSTSPPPDGE